MGFLVNSFLPFSGAFTPADLFAGSEDGAWYDPSDISTLWQDTAGTSAVTASGQSVARIDDKSGNGRHLTQATASARPTYTESGGLYYLDFDGGDFLESASGANIVEGGGTLAASASSDNAEGISGIIEERIDDTNDDKRVVLYFDTRNTLFRHSAYAADATTRLISYASEQGAGEKVLMLVSDGTNAVGYDNNSTVGSSVSSTSNFNTNSIICLGRQAVGDIRHDGKIYGAIILDRALTTSERGNLNSYLGAKAGL